LDPVVTGVVLFCPSVLVVGGDAGVEGGETGAGVILEFGSVTVCLYFLQLEFFYFFLHHRHLQIVVFYYCFLEEELEQ